MPPSASSFVTEASQLLESLASDRQRQAARRDIISKLETAEARLLPGGRLRERRRRFCPGFWGLLGFATSILLARGLYKASSPECLLPSAWLREMARPPSNCSAMCAGLAQVPVERDLTVERFLRLYAYSGRPVLVKNGTAGWRAHEFFSYAFIRDMHDRHPSAYGNGRTIKVIDPFNVELATLRDALHMSEERRLRPFYFGWKNLNRGVFRELQQFHQRPSYLGPEIEHPAADWFYIGTAARAALLHIDFFSRPSWQAQISGRKRWLLHPPVECESVCSPLQVDIEPGDILNVDPNQWYHATYVLDGTFSITLGSEYM